MRCTTAAEERGRDAPDWRGAARFEINRNFRSRSFLPQNHRFLGSQEFFLSQESSKLREIQFQMVQMDGLDQGICLTTYIQSENHDTCSIWPKGAYNMSFLMSYDSCYKQFPSLTLVTSCRQL